MSAEVEVEFKQAEDLFWARQGRFRVGRAAWTKGMVVGEGGAWRELRIAVYLELDYWR